MDNLADHKSSINVSNLIIYFGGVYIFYIILSSIFNTETGTIITYILTVLLFYATLYYQVNIFFFFEDRIEVRYFFRFLNRVKIHKFEEIVLVRYLHSNSRYSPPTIQLIFSKMKRKTILPSNSFTMRFFKNRKAILKFLDSKGILIEIKSVFERDEYILD
jgi:hypothetical protein